MKKRALVTGGCGFIGSNLSKSLVEDGWTVDIVDDMSSGDLNLLSGTSMRVVPIDLLRSYFESPAAEKRETDQLLVIQGDFSHQNTLTLIREGRYDVVFHQAAIPRVSFSVENPSATTDVNVASTVRLFEACIDNVKRIVWASSSSVYGGADVMPTPVTTPRNPKSPYAWQKSTIEDLSKMFCNLYDIDIVCLRYFNVFGPGQLAGSPYSTAVSAWCHAIKNDLPLRSDGDGTQSRDLCYVDNVVSANMLAAISDTVFSGKAYNVCCGDRTSNREILNFLTDRFPDIGIEDAPWRTGDVMHTQGDWSAARDDFGYSPLVRFWEGMERTLDWWELKEDEV